MKKGDEVKAKHDIQVDIILIPAGTQGVVTWDDPNRVDLWGVKFGEVEVEVTSADVEPV